MPPGRLAAQVWNIAPLPPAKGKQKTRHDPDDCLELYGSHTDLTELLVRARIWRCPNGAYLAADIALRKLNGRMSTQTFSM